MNMRNLMLRTTELIFICILLSSCGTAKSVPGTIDVKVTEYIGGIAGMDIIDHTSSITEPHVGDTIFKLRNSSINDNETIKIIGISEDNAELTIKCSHQYINSLDPTSTESNEFIVKQGETLSLREKNSNTTGINISIAWNN